MSKDGMVMKDTPSLSLRIISRNLVLFGGVVLLAVVATGIARYYGSASLRHYSQLNVGMSRFEVEATLEKKAAYVYSLKNNLIEYHLNSRLLANEVPRDTIAQVDSILEIPYIYDAFQLMYDKSGTLVAYSWNGETKEIVTTRGSFPGSSLQKLPPEILDVLVNQP